MKTRVTSLGLVSSGLLLFSLVLSGCAGSSSPYQEELSGRNPGLVSRLEDGRTGFVIRESDPLDDDMNKLFERGVSALESNDYEAAADIFRRISEATPHRTAPYINLAIAFIRSDRDGQAEEPLKKALELVAGHPLASHEYGLLLRRAGRFEEARTVYEKSLNRFPEYFPLRKNLGVLCDLYLNDLKCAKREYGLFLEAQPEDEQVKLWLVEVQGRLAR